MSRKFSNKIKRYNVTKHGLFQRLADDMWIEFSSAMMILRR